MLSDGVDLFQQKISACTYAHKRNAEKNRLDEYVHGVDHYLILTFLASLGAGAIGALVGLGGGVMIVPLLTIGFGVDIRLAVGASIVSVIATSSGAGAALLRDRLTNVRVATLLQVATSVGAIAGALIAPFLPTRVLFLLFGGLLLFTIFPMLRKVGSDEASSFENDKWAMRLSLPGSYPDRRTGREISYPVRGVPVGFAMMGVAGLVSGLLGIGSGALKVLSMDSAMGLPIKVSSATSNFMIGVTAAASAGIYFWRGDVLPFIAAPVALGVLLGSILGARLLIRFRSETVRIVFIIMLALVAIQMLLRGLNIA